MSLNAETPVTPWFSVGQPVIVSGGGVGKIIEVGRLVSPTPEGHRYYRINFGPTKCHTCNRPSGDRIEWALALHISLTVSERKRLEHASV